MITGLEDQDDFKDGENIRLEEESDRGGKKQIDFEQLCKEVSVHENFLINKLFLRKQLLG